MYSDALSFDKHRMVMKAFRKSQFHNCPLIWMFHSGTLNNKINRPHERALSIVYFDYKSVFRELLEKDKLFSIYHKNIQSLALIFLELISLHYGEHLNSIKLSLMILEKETYFKVEIPIL